MQNIISEKKSNSLGRLSRLKKRLENVEELNPFGNLSVYVAGSYARGEASKHSDIDLFFIYDGHIDQLADHRTKTFRAFSKIIEIADELEFPAFSNDGEYLKIIEKPAMTKELGGRDDDYKNYFTARMLMLLESKPVYDEDIFYEILKDVLGAYFRDYTHHPKDFRPVFLINDIIRFWKTLCLNYEHKRNQPEEDPERKIKQKLKNFKLKFSRMMTCYGTIVSIIGDNNGISDPETILELGKISPFERLERTVLIHQATRPYFEIVSEEYTWFLEQTNVSGGQLLESFKTKAMREEAFERADRFGEAMFQITFAVAEESRYMRYLLI